MTARTKRPVSGPLEREVRKSTSERGSSTVLVTRIDSPAMPSILLDR